MSRWNALILSGLVALAPVAAPTVADAAPKKAATKKAATKKSDRPGDKKASTKGLEEALRRSDEPQAAAAAAPASALSQAPGREVTVDEKADAARDEAITSIQKLLPKQKNPEVRADLLFQLAELWWEKSRFVNLKEEMPAFEKAYAEWGACVREKGEKACSAEPRINNRKSELYRKNAVDLYTQIIKDYPRYPRLDEVRFILAYNKYELCQALEGPAKTTTCAEAVATYRQLIALNPDSPFVSNAYVQLGEHYFNSNQLREARKAFEEALALNDPRTATYAEYKLAWCDINSGDYKMAVERFQNVIAKGTREADKVRLKDEALRDIIVAYRSEPDSRDAAIKYFQRVTGRDGSRDHVNRLANAYFDAGRYDDAIETYRHLVGQYKFAAKAPDWQSRIVLSFDKKNDRGRVFEEMRTLVNNYRPGSDWHKANLSDKPAIEFAYSLTEEALYNLVTEYHQEAIKTKSVATYRLARDIYKEYIDNFPSTERSYQMRFYYAEILYALEEYQPAYDEYVKVAFDQERDDYKRVSATNMLLAAEKLVDIEAGRYVVQVNDSTSKIDENKDKGVVTQKQIVKAATKDTQAEDLSPMEQQLIVACDQYNELIPNAEDEARVRLRAAVIYFDRAQFVEAADRFGYIINKWPQERSSATAAVLVLASLEIKEEWESLNKLSREFRDNKQLLAGNSREKTELRTKLPVYVEGSQFKIASETNDVKKDYPLAARQFREFVAEFPQSKFAPVALYNAFVIYQRAKELDTAIEMGEKLYADYRKWDTDDAKRRLADDDDELRPAIMPLLVFDLAKTYEQTADFAKAAYWYEKFADEHGSDPRVADAQFNAALWRQGLGEYDAAIKTYEAYIKTYNKVTNAEDRAKLAPAHAVVFEIARIHEVKKEWKKAFDKYEEYKRAAPGRAEALNATYRQFLIAEQQDRPKKERMSIADDLLERYGKLGSDEERRRDTSRLAAAHARFFKLGDEFEKYEKIVFDSPATVNQRFRLKLESKKKLEDGYLEVVGYGNGDWAIAALVRTAMLPRLFARSLLEAPIPKGLDFEQEELYRALLEERALEFEEPAITLLEAAIDKSFELKVYNEWTLEAQKLMAEFKSDYYTEIRELPLQGAEFFFTADARQQPADQTAGAGGD